ncbi:hypothetical protein K7W42_20370 [Deinococcus sp. HMF7604]|uniref:hypothetical protein n=1 Tax=Deinococcus betulae TaxID=2873312 RepID=UPI001CC95837|nr:hypothetical protein [Deinococcus betulae]MBZ9753195.1 hypothetical protein [Deinococcus betulae]
MSQSDSTPDKEARRRRVSPEDLAALQRRAAAWAQVGGGGRAGVQARARAAYALYLDFLRHNVGGDFPRWLSTHSGAPQKTCWRALKAGRALAAGSKANRNQSGLLAEQREREQTPVANPINWDEE